MSPDSDPQRDPQRRSALPEKLRYKPMGAAYQGAVEAVFAIALAMGVGYWADRQWDTSPVGLLVGATIGFGAFVLRLYRLGAAQVGSPSGDSGGGETSPERPSVADPGPVKPERSEPSGSERSSGGGPQVPPRSGSSG